MYYQCQQAWGVQQRTTLSPPFSTLNMVQQCLNVGEPVLSVITQCLALQPQNTLAEMQFQLLPENRVH